ncbi:type I-F CRISPR-associated protein Csy1 [Gynuella sp.]|uniref:type I-F CRISPR-associated protein Csy1 n=1 Tax=Gynuella sp. TaxID=2969146 RepID=UPI003D14A033
MPDPAIQEFFNKRQEDWLKKTLKPTMTAEEISDNERLCAEKFSKAQWLPDAAKRAGQINIASHPCTFSHPSARKNKNGYVTSIIAEAPGSADGFVRTGNVNTEHDALGNAAAIDVYKFLTLTMEDGQTLIEHIRNDSNLARELLTVESDSYDNLKTGFMAMVTNDATSVTSSKIKQVYFPIDDGQYHLLSVLSHSGLIYELRNRIDRLRFSEEIKSLREKRRNNEYSEQGYAEIYDITTIGFGGTKPQNISVLNNQYGGKARLLLSVPPHLEKRDIHFPVRNFFINSIRYYDIQEPLQKLHGIFRTGLDGDIPRRNLESGRDHRIEDILETVINRMVAIRTVASEQYRADTSQLEQHQKIWLCDEYRQIRAEQDQWLQQLCEEIAEWIAKAYQKVIKKPVTLGMEERDYIRQMILVNKEWLR